MPLQGKLLRVLQEGQVDVVGSDDPVPVDVRLVAATHQALPERVSQGLFREDLFFRLNVIEIAVPPLRDRLDDIVPLARAFIDELSPGRELALPEAVALALRRRSWRGNVRELRNVCERLAILTPDDAVRLADLPAESFASSAQGWLDLLPEGLSLVDLEAQVIRHFLDKHTWNVSEAARRLGVPRHILAYRIEKHGLHRVDDESAS